MKDEALKLALEALEWMVANDDTNEGDEPVERLGGQSWNEYNAYWLDGLNNSRAAITAIKQALAAPTVQEPVAWAMYQRGRLQSFWLDKGDAYDFEFTSEHEWKPLYTTPPAQPAPVQEPVAQLGDGVLWCDTCRSVTASTHHSNPNDRDVWCEGEAKWLQGPFYTTPPAQPAVPDAIIEAGESPEFRDGWNECRETILQMLKARKA